jgi:imidazolonepropionase-like amidohydrolase
MLCDDLAKENAMSDTERLLMSAKFSEDSLNAGFTTLRDLGARNLNTITLRNLIRQGVYKGPDLFVAGRILSPPTEGNSYYPGMYVEPVTSAEIDSAIKEEINRGVDFIKFMGGSDLTAPGGLEDITLYDGAQTKAIASTAIKYGTYSAAHCQTPFQARTAIDAGVRTIEHAFILNDQIIEDLKKETSFLVPTMRYLDTLRQYPETLPDHMKNYIDEYIENVALWLNKAYKAGLRMGFGTDAGTFGNYHGDNAKEAELRVKLAGIDSLEVIKQATIYSAMIMGLEDRGVIDVGKRADLVAFANDPVEDITELERPILVIKEGNIIKQNLSNHL